MNKLNSLLLATAITAPGLATATENNQPTQEFEQALSQCNTLIMDHLKGRVPLVKTLEQIPTIVSASYSKLCLDALGRVDEDEERHASHPNLEKAQKECEAIILNLFKDKHSERPPQYSFEGISSHAVKHAFICEFPFTIEEDHNRLVDIKGPMLDEAFLGEGLKDMAMKPIKDYIDSLSK